MTPHEQRHKLDILIKSKKDAVRDKYDALVAKEYEEIDREHRQERSALEKQCREIDHQRELERIAKASTGTLGGVPIGGKVVEWKSKFRMCAGDYIPTGVTGVVELCTHDSKFGSNVSSYSHPSIGKLFIRILKKDGTPSLKFASGFALDGSLPYRWHPEGVDPNIERNKK